jgi:hypothetical protein
LQTTAHLSECRGSPSSFVAFCALGEMGHIMLA